MTFKISDTIRCETKELFLALLAYARAKEVPVYELTGESSYPAFKGLVFSSDGHLCGGNSINNINIGTFLEYCDNWKEEGVLPIRLNETYTAFINKGEKLVKVGCQEIPFSAIEEVYKAIQ